jgi:hypothetical protein
MQLFADARNGSNGVDDGFALSENAFGFCLHRSVNPAGA